MATAAAPKRLLLATVLAALCAPAANAGLISGVTNVVAPTCGTTSKPFAQFGDNNDYYAVPNNGLESGSAGWSLGSGAYVAPGNEPWYVGGFGARSLALRPGSTAYSPAACINLFDPHIRAFAKSNGADAALRIQVLFYGLTGNLLGALNWADQEPGAFADWQPTGNVASVLAVPLTTSYFRVKFTSLAQSGSWQVDDLYVDPWVIRG